MRRLRWKRFVVTGLVSFGTLWGQSAPVRVSEGVMAGQLQAHPAPVYPPIAKAAGVSGAVVLRAIVDAMGHTTNLQVVSGPELLRASAMDAVRRWVFRPYVLNGEPTAVDTTVTVNFQLAPPVDAKNSGGSGQETSSQETTRVPLEPSEQRSQGHLVQLPGADTFCGSTQKGQPGFHIRVSGGVMQGLLVKRVDPVYPRGSVAGAEILRVCVDAAGTVEKMQVVSGPEALREAARKAIAQWQYRPYLLNGVATPVDTTVSIVY